MASYQGSEAYDFELFEYRGRYNASGSSSAENLPEEYETAPSETAQTHNVNKKAVKKQLRTLNLANIAVSVIMAAVLLFGSGLLLYMRAAMDDYASKINSINKKIKLEKSDNIRFTNELDAMFSKREVENYAENVLGMVKLDTYNTIQIKLPKTDAVVIAGGKTSITNPIGNEGILPANTVEHKDSDSGDTDDQTAAATDSAGVQAVTAGTFAAADG